MRADHAAARDAVLGMVDPAGPEKWGCLLALESRAPDREAYIARPEDGRRLAAGEAERLAEWAPGGCDVLVAVADGLSCAAVEVQVPRVIPALLAALGREGVGRVEGPVFVRNGRVGIVDPLGAATGARLVILLVGERPGLSTAESLSIYFAFDPGPGRTDADRNVISNIHSSGTLPEQAALQAASWARRMLDEGVGGVRFRP